MTTEIIWISDDWFVAWESIVEAPIAWDSRKRMEKWANAVMRHRFGASAEPQGPRFDRATLRQGGSYIHCDKPTIERSWIFEQRGLLRGSKMREFLDSYDPITEHFDLSLLEPIEPGDPDFGTVRQYAEGE